MLPDLRAAFRSLSKAPGLALLATATLAVGMGASTAIFSAVDAVVLRPLPYRSGLLFGVAPRDPATLTGIALFLSAVAIGTGAIGARRAARTDPTTALRHDRKEPARPAREG